MPVGIPSPVHHARLLLAHGRLLRRQGQRRLAVERLQRASEMYQALRAAPFMARSEEELAACQLPGSPAKKHSVLSLTSRETEVAHLVGKGAVQPRDRGRAAGLQQGGGLPAGQHLRQVRPARTPAAGALRRAMEPPRRRLTGGGAFLGTRPPSRRSSTWATRWRPGRGDHHRRGELSIDVSGLEILSKAPRPLPDKWHGLSEAETRYRQREVDLLANSESRRVFDIRFRTLSILRDRLEGQGFLEVETPILQPQAGRAQVTIL